MKNLVILFLLFLIPLSAQDHVLKGKVTDSETGYPLQNANIIIWENGRGTSTDENGEFTLKGVQISNTVIISYIGYRPSTRKIETTDDLFVSLEPVPIPSQTVLVEASVGTEGVTPAAFSKIKKEEIQNRYTVKDIPEFLSTLPSTTFYSESGNGIGYNYLSIRGFDQRRITVSINGIPQNDPEDHNVYWLDFPDLLASTSLIQVQRGAGAGVFGFPSIGGTINIITSGFTAKPEIKLNTSFGSYNTRKYSASFSSGLIDDKYSVYGSLSKFKAMVTGINPGLTLIHTIFQQ
jgi:iron complex outermembrane recepter protein